MTYGTNGAAAVLALEINRNGEVTKKLNPLDREHELTNTLLQGLYPGIAVATVDVPQEDDGETRPAEPGKGKRHGLTIRRPVTR